MSNIIEDITNTLSGNDNISSVEYNAIMTALDVIKDKLDKYIPIIESNVVRLNTLNENIQVVNDTVIDTSQTYKTLIDIIDVIKTKVNESVHRVNLKLSEFEDKISGFDSDNIRQMQSDININKNNIGSLDDKIDGIKDNLNGYINNNDYHLNDINNRIGVNVANIEALKIDVDSNATEIQNVKDVLETFEGTGEVDLTELINKLNSVQGIAGNAMSTSSKAASDASKAVSMATNAVNKTATNEASINNINTSIESITGAVSEHTTNIESINTRLNNINTDMQPSNNDIVILNRLKMSELSHDKLLDNTVYFYDETVCVENNINKIIFVDGCECRIVKAFEDIKGLKTPDIIIVPITKEININRSRWSSLTSKKELNLFVNYGTNKLNFTDYGIEQTANYPLPGDTINVRYKDSIVRYLAKDINFTYFDNPDKTEYSLICVKVDSVAIPASTNIIE